MFLLLGFLQNFPSISLQLLKSVNSNEKFCNSWPSLSTAFKCLIVGGLEQQSGSYWQIGDNKWDPTLFDKLCQELL